MTNVRRFQNGLQIIPVSVSTVSQLGELEVSSSATKLNFHNGTTPSYVVTEQHSNQGADRLQNKDLDASNVEFVDPTDTTKTMATQLSGAATGTETELIFNQTANRQITFPDATGFLVLSGSAGVITNNLLDESSVWFVDHTDTTKAFKFNVSGATTATSVTLQSSQTANRIWILQDSSDTVVGRNTTDTLTNKTLTSPILNTPTADTITGIAGGALTVQSASNQNLVLQAQGTGVVTLENLTIINDHITGSTAADLTIATQNNKNLQLSPNGSGSVIVNAPMTNEEYVNWIRTNDTTTTGTAATLTASNNPYIKVTNVSLVSLSGIPAGINGQLFILTNGTGASFLVNNQDASVTAANRILTGTNNFISFSNDASLIFIYDTDVSRWRIVGGSGSGGAAVTFGTRGSPEAITGSVGLSASAGNMSTFASSQLIFLAGNGGPVTVTASPAIQAGTIVGQLMSLVGRDNTNTVSFTNSSGSLELNGNITLGLDDVLSLFWDGTAWVETSRSK